MPYVTIDELAAEKYISLATYKKDGTRVATPVWLAREGEHLYVITEASSGKAKRLRNSSRAQVAPCDMRGNVHGPVTNVTAILLDEKGTAHVKALIDKRYGLMARLISLTDTVRRLVGKGGQERVGIQITPTPADLD